MIPIETGCQFYHYINKAQRYTIKLQRNKTKSTNTINKMIESVMIYIYIYIIEAPFYREWMWSSGLGRWT